MLRKLRVKELQQLELNWNLHTSLLFIHVELAVD